MIFKKVIIQFMIQQINRKILINIKMDWFDLSVKKLKTFILSKILEFNSLGLVYILIFGAF